MCHKNKCAFAACLLACLLLPSCMCVLHQVETRTEIVPVWDKRPAVAEITPAAISRDESAFALSVIKIIPWVELFTDKPTKAKAIAACKANGAAVKVVTTRRSRWFVVDTQPVPEGCD